MIFRTDQRVTLEDVENLYRENIVQEISELVHRQLVTSSLQSTFRNVLEISMQVRVILTLWLVMN